MLLRSLDDADGAIKVCLLQTPSQKLEMFMEDKLKRMLGSTNDTIIDLVNKKDIKEVKNIQTIDPPFAKKWLIRVDLKKFGVNKELLQLINESTTCLFFCKADKYVTYKSFKDLCKKVDYFYDFYLNTLRRNDLLYLYTCFVPQSNQLTKQLFDYVAQSYSADIEAIFDLFLELASGAEIKNRKDIADICGIGGNSIESFVFSLLKPPPITEKGVKTVLRNRLKAGLELADVYGLRKFYNFLNSALKSILDIKMLCMSGAVYKQLINLPDGYDERKLSKYQRYLWKIKEIPTTRILRCKYMLTQSQGWNDELEFVLFVYSYMLDLQRYEVQPYIDILVVDDKTENDTRSIEDEEPSYDIEEFKRAMRVDYSAKAAKIRYDELVKQGVMPEITEEDNKPFIKESMKHNQPPASGLFGSTDDLLSGKDTRSPLDIALLIASGNFTYVDDSEKEKIEVSDEEVYSECESEVSEDDNSLNSALEYMQSLLNK